MRSITAALVGFLIFLLAGASAPAWSSQHNEFGTAQREAIEEIIREYLLKNPEVIVESLENAREQQAQQEAERVRAVLQESREELVNDPRSPVGGNPKGDVTIVEFFDYRCPYCKRVSGTLVQLMEEDPKLRVVMKEFPILSQESVQAARAGLAAARQGKYHSFHFALMDKGGSFSDQEIFAVAQSVGLDVERLRADMQDPAIESTLRRVHRLAGKLGISGTPAFVIGDTLVPGAVGLEQLRALVAEARAQQS